MQFTRKEIKSALFSLIFLGYCSWAVNVGTPVAKNMGDAWERVTDNGN